MTEKAAPTPQEPKSAATHRLQLRVLPARLAVCCLPPEAPVPNWTTHGAFHSITRTDEELSIICDYAVVPSNVTHEGPWACLVVEGPLDFSLTGVLASLANPLADAGVSIFAVSTYRTDYVLVPERDLGTARQALSAAGHLMP